MNLEKKILYVGSLNESSNSYRRLLALQRLGHEVIAIDSDQYIYQSIFYKIQHHLNLGPGVNRLSKQILDTTIEFKPSLVWVDNRPFVSKQCIHAIKKSNPSTYVLNLLTDDPFGKYSSGWRMLKKTAYLYDYIFVQRTPNIAELQNIGAKKVFLCDRSFDPILHKPLQLSLEERQKFGSKIGFVGTYAPYRASIIKKLIEDNIEVYIWGNDWHKSPDWTFFKPYFKSAAIYQEQYTKVINSIDIHLHFLRKENRDDQDSRTFEIPACGGFMIAERTEKHQKYFQEGIEAEYFSSYEELKNKILLYIKKPNLIKQIGNNAHIRSIQNGYDHDNRLRTVINQVFHK